MADYDNFYPLSAARQKAAFHALMACHEQVRQLSEGTCVQFSLEADENTLETCLAYFRKASVKLEFLGVLPNGLRNMQLTAS